MHGRDYRGENIEGWLVTEKFEGCRMLWDGSRAWSKQGNEIILPSHWDAALPKFAIEGEVWAGRGRFLDSRNAVNFGHWTDQITLQVFDAPSVPGTWLQRLDRVADAIARCEFAELVEPVVATSSLQIEKWISAVQSDAGEGLMARTPGNLYVPGRTSEILKLKKATRSQWSWYHEEMERPPIFV